MRTLTAVFVDFPTVRKSDNDWDRVLDKLVAKKFAAADLVDSMYIEAATDMGNLVDLSNELMVSGSADSMVLYVVVNY